jgi:hypothetical protein
MFGPSPSSPINIAATCSSCNIGTLSFMPTPSEIVLVFGSDFSNFPNQSPSTVQSGVASIFGVTSSTLNTSSSTSSHNVDSISGNTFTDSPSVDKRSFVGDVQFGFAFTYGDARLAFTHVYRTKEFFGQPDADEFGAISLSVGL